MLNANLIWKLPATTDAAAKTAASESAESASAPEEPAPDPVPAVDKAPPEEPARKSGSGASVFDPY